MLFYKTVSVYVCLTTKRSPHKHIYETILEIKLQCLLPIRNPYLVMNPEHDLVAVPQELHQDQRLLQLHPLLGQSGQQQLPETMQLLEAASDGVRGKMADGDHLTSGVVEDDDRVGVRCHFRFERLVLLDLGLCGEVNR